MNRQDVKRLTDDFRSNIYVKTVHGMTVVDLDQWGAGEYRVTYDICEKYGKYIHLYIPYATMSTLEKAIVFTRFAYKQGAKLRTTIGYVAYGRQERETGLEPELFSVVKDMIAHLHNVHIIDPHNIPSALEYNTEWFSPKINDMLPKGFLIVAPDKGADTRNKKLNLHSDYVIEKVRTVDGVKSRIIEDDTFSGEVFNDPIDFIIYDDICDGGRTFVNVADIMRAKYPNCTITLCVAHAILPFGTDHLKGKINKIITSNTCFPAGTYDDGFLDVLNALNIFY